MNNYIWYLIPFCLLFSCVSDYSSKKSSVSGFDYGTVKKTTYSNQFFEMEFDFPADWSVQSRNEISQMIETGKEIVTEGNKALGDILDASEINSAYLFTIFQYHDKTSVAFDPSLMLIVENLKGNPAVKEGKDYLANVKQLLLKSNQGYIVSENIDRKSLGGKSFDFLETSLSNSTTTVKQEYIATILKGFSFSFILSYSTPEEQQALHGMLNSLRFKQ